MNRIPSILVSNFPVLVERPVLAIGRTGKVKVEMHHVSLKSIVPVVLKDEGKKQQLVEDLTQMGCKGLLVQPWGLKSEEMAQEFFLYERSNE